MKTLTAGVIGCGRMGADFGRGSKAGMPPGWLPYSHAAALASCEGIRLERFCDPQNDRLAEAGERFAVTRLSESVEDFLAGDPPNIVAVATRTPGRCALIEQCLAAGVRGLHVEKPLGWSLAEIKQTLAQVRKSDAVLSYGATRRGMATYRHARALVEEGVIGTVRHIGVEHGRDLLLWGHPHSVDLALFFAGTREVDWVQASCETAPEDFQDDRLDCDPPLLCAHMCFANGVAATITQTAGLSVRITGDSGHIIVDSDGTSVELRRRNRTGPYFAPAEAVPVEVTESGTVYCFQRLRDAVNGDDEALFALEDIEAGMRLLLACAWSSLADGRRVSPLAVPEDFTVTGQFRGLYP